MYQDSIDEATLIVDIGNTNITCGVYQAEKLTWFVRLFSSPNRTADEYYSLLNSLLKDVNGVIRYIAFASVVPELTRIWQHLFQKYFTAVVREIHAGSRLGLSFKVAEPGFIGSDLVANAFGAWKKYQANCIVIDLGTATTIQFVTEKGSFEGTVIAPGIRTGADQLFSKAALLSQIEITTPQVLLGTNTRDAMLSGIVHGHAFMLEAYIQRIKLHYFEYKNVVTVLTGGIADLVKPLVPSVDYVDKTLTLEGIFLANQQLRCN